MPPARRLMNRGKETKDEFLRLCQLLVDVGSRQKIFFRNLNYYEGEALYTKLLGTTKQDEFDAAIQAFKSRFNVQLSRTENDELLVSIFRIDGGPPFG